jgi:RimJ/RimL family protein N-acetyltransferase
MHFETERLIIRKLREADLHDLHAFRSDPEVCRYQGYEPETLDGCRQLIEWQMDKEFGPPNQWVKVGMELKSEKKLIGDISVKPEGDVRIVEFGISLSRDYQGKGLASEALTAIFDHLFAEKEVHRITAVMDVDNTAIIALMDRLGFRKEGHYIKSFFDNGEWRDEYFYALLRQDWIAGTVSNPKSAIRNPK